MKDGMLGARFGRAALIATLLAAVAMPAIAAPLTGAAAYGDWRTDAPGVVRKITPADVVATGASPVGFGLPALAPRPAGAELKTLPGFTVTPFATGLQGPRLIRVAPNGD